MATRKTTSRKAARQRPGKRDAKVAVVTGGSRGIGRAIASALAGAGYAVIITGRDEEALEQVSAELNGRRRSVFARHCDVRSAESVSRLFRAIASEFGHVDVLVNNAGIAGPSATVDKLSPEAWTEVIETNLTGTFLVTKAALPLLRRGSTIINNMSVAAKNVFPGMSAYIASKHGTRGFSDALREELRPRGIRVVNLMPGATATDIWEQFWPDAPRERMMSADSIAQAVLATIALPENASVDEIVIAPTGGAL